MAESCTHHVSYPIYTDRYMTCTIYVYSVDIYAMNVHKYMYMNVWETL